MTGETPRRVGRPRSEERRAAILAAAGELMLEGGLGAATMEAIATRAGVSKATIYKYWPSRGAVALEGFMRFAAASATPPEDGTAVEALEVLVRNAVTLFSHTSAGPLMRSLAADAQSQPEIADALREQWLGPRRAAAAALIREGMASGELRPDLDVPVALDLLFGPVYYRLLFTHEPLDDEFARRSVRDVMAGLRARDGRAAPPSG